MAKTTRPAPPVPTLPPAPPSVVPPAPTRVLVRTRHAVSRWRAGLCFGRTPVLVDLMPLAPEVIARLFADADLIIEPAP